MRRFNRQRELGWRGGVTWREGQGVEAEKEHNGGIKESIVSSWVSSCEKVTVTRGAVSGR